MSCGWFVTTSCALLWGEGASWLSNMQPLVYLTSQAETQGGGGGGSQPSYAEGGSSLSASRTEGVGGSDPYTPLNLPHNCTQI